MKPGAAPPTYFFLFFFFVQGWFLSAPTLQLMTRRRTLPQVILISSKKISVSRPKARHYSKNSLRCRSSYFTGTLSTPIFETGALEMTILSDRILRSIPTSC